MSPKVVICCEYEFSTWKPTDKKGQCEWNNGAAEWIKKTTHHAKQKTWVAITMPIICSNFLTQVFPLNETREKKADLHNIFALGNGRRQQQQTLRLCASPANHSYISMCSPNSKYHFNSENIDSFRFYYCIIISIIFWSLYPLYAYVPIFFPAWRFGSLAFTMAVLLLHSH